jgi:hypothetical protein
MKPQRRELLLLWDNARSAASTVEQHIRSLTKYSRHALRPVAIMGDLPPLLDLSRFDAVVLHYSLTLCSNESVSELARDRLARFKGMKILFIQDEYRHVDRSVRAMREIGIDVLFTCVPTGEIDKVYPESALPGVLKHNVLTGYVDEALLAYPVIDPTQRRIDIGYRARKVPAWLGELGQEKWNIGQRVAVDAKSHGLVVDLAYREEERLYGDDWLKFMADCKATLGVESGASVFDFSGRVQAAVESDLALDPTLDFETLRSRHFAHLEHRIRLNQISPRCFEAAALRTLMILYEGEYSGRLTPWRHYVPLRKDHGNFAEVVAALRDATLVRDITDRAYREVALAEHNSFRHMVAEFDNVIDALDAHGFSQRSLAPYPEGELSLLARQRTLSSRWALRRRRLFTLLYFFVFRRFLGWMPEAWRDRIQLGLRQALRSGLALMARSR